VIPQFAPEPPPPHDERADNNKSSPALPPPHDESVDNNKSSPPDDADDDGDEPS
jgi:hypothetical protein